MTWDAGLDPLSPAYAIASAQNPRVRVLAGPGTGKSYAMKRRVARLLESGVSPAAILPVTFTRVAADDLHRELLQLQVAGCDRLHGRTLHSLALNILSRQHVLASVGRKAHPLTRFEENAMICDLAEAHGGKRKAKELRNQYLAAWALSQGQAPGFAANSAEQAYSLAAKAWLSFHDCMLIGEVVPYLLHYLHNNPLARERSEFSHVLVDEFQDLNQAEQLIIQLLSANAAEMVVGDDDQSIYSFKYAHPTGIQHWPHANPGCADVALTDCQRCPTTVVDMANALISHNQNRMPRNLQSITSKGAGEVNILQFPTVDAEAIWIAGRIANLIQSGYARPQEIIVLAQRALIAKRIMQELTNKSVAATSFYEESMLDTEAPQQRFALFKLHLNSGDKAALRFLLGVGHPDMRAAQYGRLRAYCEQSGDSPWEALEKLGARTIRIAHTQQLVTQFMVIKGELAQLTQHTANLTNFVDALFPANNPALSAVRAIAITALQIATTPDKLLEEMVTAITQPEIPPPINEVRLMSLHKSKGLSAPFVFIASCVQGLLPKIKTGVPPQVAAASMEEQRRLFYVGITRVKSDPNNNRVGALYLTYSQTMPAAMAHSTQIQPTRIIGGEAYLQPSAFLSQLGPNAPRPQDGRHVNPILYPVSQN